MPRTCFIPTCAIPRKYQGVEITVALIELFGAHFLGRASNVCGVSASFLKSGE